VVRSRVFRLEPDTGRPGDIIPETKRDDQDHHVAWAGIRAAGTLKPRDSLIEKFGYKLDLIGAGGSEDDIATVSGPGSRERTITAVNGRKVRAWAFDGRLTFVLNTLLKPVVTLGYAFGSGDGDPSSGTDHAFRQSGMQTNASPLGLSANSVYQYGEVLRPELSNLHILTAGAAFPMGESADLGFFYHYYALAEDADFLRRASVSARLAGADKSLGQEADLVFNMDAGQLFRQEKGKIVFRTTAGVFDAGPAYGAAENEKSVRIFTELGYRL
jgi:hypothetical protein